MVNPRDIRNNIDSFKQAFAGYEDFYASFLQSHAAERIYIKGLYRLSGKPYRSFRNDLTAYSGMGLPIERNFQGKK